MAGLDCKGSLFKYSVFLMALVIFISGAIILGVGIWAQVDPSFSKYIEILSVDNNDPLWHTTTIILTAVGAFIFVVGFLGCCGACKESPCMLWMYIFFLVVIFLAQIVAAIVAIVFRNDLMNMLEKTMKEQAITKVQDKYRDTGPLNLAWHAMQVQLDCCGGLSYKDYRDSEYFNQDRNPVPRSCCILRPDGMDPLDPKPSNLSQCYEDARKDWEEGANTEALHTTGCVHSLNEWLRSKTAILLGVAFAIAFLQLLGIVFACCLRKEILADK